MTDKEIIQALRCCEKEVCADGMRTGATEASEEYRRVCWMA